MAVMVMELHRPSPGAEPPMATPAQDKTPGFSWHPGPRRTRRGRRNKATPQMSPRYQSERAQRLLPGAAAAFDAFRASCFTTLIIAAAAKVRRVVKQIH